MTLRGQLLLFVLDSITTTLAATHSSCPNHYSYKHIRKFISFTGDTKYNAHSKVNSSSSSAKVCCGT